MVQKSKRGRPRGYDPDAALAAARDAFWDEGYAATSLDDLSARMEMNRPSLYGAFGDKRSLYHLTLGRYREASRAGLTEGLSYDLPLREALQRVLRGALAVYLSGEKGARGCYMIGPALAEALNDLQVRGMLADGLDWLDELFAARIAFAKATGEIDASVEPAARGKLVTSMMHALAIRARAGKSQAELEAMIAATLDMICGRPEQATTSR
jgi:TetR/AcrR family transcriptional regulator, copper-responsive repressor